MSTPAPATTRHETYALVFNTVYIGLMVNLLVAIGCAPLIAVALLTDTTRSWPLLALLTPLCAPTLVGAFNVLRAFSQEGANAVLPAFVRGWWRSARPAVGLGAAATALLVVLGVDIVWALRQPWGGLAVPILAVLMALAVGTVLLVLVALAETVAGPGRPVVRLVPLVKVCAYLAVRRWYLTVLSLVVVAAGQTLLGVSPALAFGVASAPLLYVVWANSRFAVRPALGA